MQPGQTVSPGGDQENPGWQYNPDSQPQPVQQAAAPAPAAAVQAAPTQVEPTPTNNTADGESVNWTASEFIAHNKSTGWYLLLILGTAVLSVLVYLLTKDKISSVVVVIVAILFGIAASRKPRQLQYRVDEQGIHIAAKSYLYQGFRSFSIVQEGAVESIWFLPLKRFMPIISIYFDPDDGDRIVDILSQNLPFEDRQLDPVDRLMHRLRF